MKRKLSLIEKLAVYLAKNSEGKSVPTFIYEVEKPEGLKKMLERVEVDNSRRE